MSEEYVPAAPPPWKRGLLELKESEHLRRQVARMYPVLVSAAGSVNALPLEDLYQEVAFCVEVLRNHPEHPFATGPGFTVRRVGAGYNEHNYELLVHASTVFGIRMSFEEERADG